MRELLRNSTFFAAASSHLAVDLLNSQRSILLAVLSVPLGLTNSLIGLVSTLYTLSASLSQPLFGQFADRFGPRWVVTGGVFWMAAMFGLAVTVPGYFALLFLVLAALGSAAFHPAGTMEATLLGRHHYQGRETTAASLFFLFGQGGLSLGPLVGGPILDQWGPPGLLLLLLLVVPIGANAGLQLAPAPGVRASVAGGPGIDRSLLAGISLAFILLAAFRSWAQANMVTFLPKYFSDLGFRPSFYGFVAALFMGGSAFGNVFGGWLADRYGKRAVAVGSLFLAALPLSLYPIYGATGWTYLLTPAAGAFIGASHSIVVVVAQRMMPDRVGAASGLVLGFMFASGSLGTLLSGLQADRFGISTLFFATAALALLGALMALRLRVDD